MCVCVCACVLQSPHGPSRPSHPSLQVYSVEEKRALALFNYEEKAAREARLMAEFKEMLGSAGGAPAKPGGAEATGGA